MKPPTSTASKSAKKGVKKADRKKPVSAKSWTVHLLVCSRWKTSPSETWKPPTTVSGQTLEIVAAYGDRAVAQRKLKDMRQHESKNKLQTRCERGHVLQKASKGVDDYCSDCEQEQPSAYECKKCNYSQCKACHSMSIKNLKATFSITTQQVKPETINRRIVKRIWVVGTFVQETKMSGEDPYPMSGMLNPTVLGTFSTAEAANSFALEQKGAECCCFEEDSKTLIWDSAGRLSRVCLLDGDGVEQSIMVYPCTLK